MTVVRRRDNPQRDVKVIEKDAILWTSDVVMGRYLGNCGGLTVVRKSDSHKGGVKGIRKVCSSVERCDSHGEA